MNADGNKSAPGKITYLKIAQLYQTTREKCIFIINSNIFQKTFHQVNNYSNRISVICSNIKVFFIVHYYYFIALMLVWRIKLEQNIYCYLFNHFYTVGCTYRIKLIDIVQTMTNFIFFFYSNRKIKKILWKVGMIHVFIYTDF